MIQQVYDIETYRNLFCIGLVDCESKTRWIYEVSDRRNQSFALAQHIYWLRSVEGRMIGFNNEFFDWPVMDHLIKIFEAEGTFTALDAYNKAQSMIESNDRFGQAVWANQRIVTQVDLFKIHHFDNPNKFTSLKKLEIAMRAADVIDLPYSPHELLSTEQMDHLIHYMCHDINETFRFWQYSKDQIKFRDELAVKYPDLGDVVNFNDTKIGKKFFERELERKLPGSCYTRQRGQRKITRQTVRQQIVINDVISPKVSFGHPEFNRVLGYLRSQTLNRKMIDDTLSDKVETKGIFKGLSAHVDGFEFVFGLGGIHGSLEGISIWADDEYDIVDVDVASFYPNLGITHGFYPAHLSADFCAIYKEVFDLRQSYGKKTAENAMLKLALNGVYGDSNNDHSPFRDAQYTMSITINGQLLLCMLAENCLYYNGQRVAGISIIQANTDGITLKVRKDHREYLESVMAWWQNHTGLVLESVDYSSMHIRDVNSYMAVKKKDGSIKRIGAYAYELVTDNPYTRELLWHKDMSMRVVAMAAEAQIIRGIPVADFIMSHGDPFDFMLAVKVPRSSRLELDGVRVQGTSRYYVSTVGGYLQKIMPPLPSGTTERRFDIQKGWTVKLTNSADDFDWSTVNHLYYITEARKLLI